MCGVGAILRTGGGTIPDDWLDLLDARLRPRGPDGHGRWRHRGHPAGATAWEAALVHRRLAVIDPADGAQPMVLETEDGPVAVAFNGCLYDHRERRAELEALGHDFRTDHSDTEVLLHGHVAWAAHLAERVEGMYAWALVDGRHGTLHLARDPFGEKPLWTASIVAGNGDEVTIAASDPRAVAAVAERAAGGSPPIVPDREWVDAYLETGFGPPGVAPWCDPPVRVTMVPGAGPPAPEPFRHAVDPPHDGEVPVVPTTPERAVETALAASVARRLESDRSLGCFLSGGVDSSLIAAFARRELGGLDTFCVRMPDPRHDESAHAETVARHLGCRHHVLDVPVEDGAIARDLAFLVRTMGRPFADASLLAAWWVARAAGTAVTVALSGDGGDELFLGYDRHARARAVAWLAPALRLLPEGLLRRGHRRGRRFALARAASIARAQGRLGPAAGLELVPPRVRARLVAGGAGGRPDPAGLHARAETAAEDAADPVLRTRAADLALYLPFDLLAKTDAASMAVPIEVRAPFLDRRLAAIALGLPSAVLLAGGRKGLLRAIARRHVPASAVDRPKQGFAVPLARWFREDGPGLRPRLAELAGLAGVAGAGEHAAADPAVAEAAGLDPGAIRRLVHEHEARGIDRSAELFAVLSLLEWRASLDEPDPVPEP